MIADSDEVARGFRDDVAQYSEMMSPGCDASLVADFWQPISSGSIAWMPRSDHLLVETETAITTADAAAKEACERALDPLLTPDPRASLEEMQTRELARDRLENFLPRLQRRLSEVSDQED